MVSAAKLNKHGQLFFSKKTKNDIRVARCYAVSAQRNTLLEIWVKKTNAKLLFFH